MAEDGKLSLYQKVPCALSFKDFRSRIGVSVSDRGDDDSNDPYTRAVSTNSTKYPS